MRPQQYYMRTLYEHQEVVIPACGTPLCPLDTFLSLMGKYIPKDFAAQCKPTAVKGE